MLLVVIATTASRFGHFSDHGIAVLGEIHVRKRPPATCLSADAATLSHQQGSFLKPHLSWVTLDDVQLLAVPTLTITVLLFVESFTTARR
jgi:hypothetical protein